jgi:hypothetical protein
VGLPFIHVVNRIRCHAQDGGTLLRETSTLEAPRPLLCYDVKTDQAVHATLLASLSTAVACALRVAGGAPPPLASESDKKRIPATLAAHPRGAECQHSTLQVLSARPAPRTEASSVGNEVIST